MPFSFFCRAGTDQHDSFFSIYASDSLVSARISYRTEKLIFTSYILQLSGSYHTGRSLEFLHGHREDTSQSGIAQGTGACNKLLAFYHKFPHRNAEVDRGHILGSAVFHSSSSIWGAVRCTRSCTEGISS